MMQKKIIFLFIAILTYGDLFSQNIDTKLFDSFCKELLKREHFYDLKKKLPGVSEVADPVSGMESIQYSDSIHSHAMKIFKSYDKKEQLNILNSELMPIFPLRDSVLLVDTTGFFPENISFSSGCFFKIIKEKYKRPDEKKANTSYLFLYKVGIRKNELILAFTFENSKKIFCCYYSLLNNSFEIVKSSML